MSVEDTRLARAVGDIQKMSATDKEEARQDSAHSTHVEFRVLHVKDYCDGKLMCTLGNYTVRHETTEAGDLDGTYVQRDAHAADNLKPG